MTTAMERLAEHRARQRRAGRAVVVQGDALNLPLPDASVDLIVTSPPYFGLRSYTDGGEHYDGQIGAEPTPAEYLDALTAATKEWLRVLKPAGSLFVNLGDKYASYEGNRGRGVSSLQGSTDRQRPAQPKGAGLAGGGFVRSKSLMMLPQRYAIRCMDELDLILRAEIIWAKPNGLPESVTDRVRRAHEQVFHFTQQPRYYADIDAIREPHTGMVTPGRRHDGAAFAATGKVASGDGTRHTDGHPAGRLPGSVWTIPTSPLRVPPELGVQHFAAYPPALVKRIVQAWSPPGGVVLDPFGGTGTTALVASAHGRVGISVDLSHDYSRVAVWRTSDPKQRQRAAR